MLFNLAYVLVPVAGVDAGHQRPHQSVERVWPKEISARIEEDEDR